MSATQDQIQKIQTIIDRININVANLEYNQNINIGKIKSEILEDINNCIKVIYRYVSEVHRVGKTESFEQKVLYTLNLKSVVNLYIKALNHPSLTRVEDMYNSDSGELDTYSPPWVIRFQDIFVLFQHSNPDETREIKDFLLYNLGENIKVVDYRKEEIIKVGKLLGLIVDGDSPKWETKLAETMVRIRAHDPHVWDENINLIPILALLTRSMDADASKNITYTFSLLVAWFFFIYYISNHSNTKARMAIADLIKSTETYLGGGPLTDLDSLIDIIADLGRIICIILYGNDTGFYPTEAQIRKTKTYRSKITLIPFKLNNDLFNFTHNGISIKNDHQLVQIINGLRISLRP